MNVLVVTGKKSENTVKKAVTNLADVLVLNIEIAAFITPNRLKASLPGKSYDLILIPGLASGDFTGLEKKIGTKIRKGPKHAVDLRYVVPYAGQMEFSATIPACELMYKKRKEDALAEAGRYEKEAVSCFNVGGLKIGGGSGMKVMAEIVDAAGMEKSDLINRIRYFEASGADIIDLGASLDSSSRDVEKAIDTARSATNLPLSIDSLEPELINKAVDCGIDMVLSLDSGNMDTSGENLSGSDVAAVIIPDTGGGIASLQSNIEKAQEIGLSKIIADPVLDPPCDGLAGSLARYHEFRKKCPDIPLFFGAGNITELIDADSTGVNALLAALAMEIGASVLFTPESSRKAYGSVRELKTASLMMMLAKKRDSPPKDLGLDLLLLKEKRPREYDVMPDDAVCAMPVVTAVKDKPEGSRDKPDWKLDPAGCFRIGITRESVKDGKIIKGKIIARHNKVTIAGSSAKEVMDAIIENNLVSRIDHAAYLGRELARAEIAIRLGRSFAQDDEL